MSPRNRKRDDEQEQEMPVVGKRPTSDDLAAAAHAAQAAALAAGEAAEKVAVALENHNGNGNGNGGNHPDARQSRGGGQQETGQRISDEATGSQAAYEEFMAALQPFIKRAGDRIRVKENAGWVKIEGIQSGERVYVSRGKRQVSRVTCTLPPESIKGAEDPPVPNGLIRSHLPATTEAVGQAILQIAGVK